MHLTSRRSGLPGSNHLASTALATALILTFPVSAMAQTLEAPPQGAEAGAGPDNPTSVGTGAAEKAQVQAMVKVLLPGVKIAGADAADALAVAIADAHLTRTL